MFTKMIENANGSWTAIDTRDFRPEIDHAAERKADQIDRKALLKGLKWTDADLERLRALGFTLEFSPSNYYGRVHAVTIDEETRRFIGVAEPRGFGGAAGPVR